MQTLSIKQALWYAGYAVFACLVLVVFIFYFERRMQTEQTAEQAQTGIRIVTTIYPLGEFVQAVAGDSAQVTVITQPGVEPHDFEPTPRDIIAMEEADLLLANGGEVDAWAQDVRKSTGSTLIMSDVIPFFTSPEGQVDPHVWLDPVLAQTMVEYIRDALVAQYPERAADYTQNAENYLRQLRDLDREYTQNLSNCDSRVIVVAHDAFGYLGRRYNLEIHSITGLSPEDEPSAKDLASLTELVREKKVPVIFFEELLSVDLAQVIARETGASTQLLDPLESASVTGRNYLTGMQKNLDSLQSALSCQP